MHRTRATVSNGTGNVIKFNGGVASARTLDTIADAAIKDLTELSQKYRRIGYVCGILTSDGMQFKDDNKALLRLYTAQISKSVNYPIFCAATLANDKIEAKIARYNQFDVNHKLWDRVMRSGLVTDMFMAPRWYLSTGSRVEFSAAVDEEMAIHHVHDHPELLAILKWHSPLVPLTSLRKS
jgi:hypothetical protein